MSFAPHEHVWYYQCNLPNGMVMLGCACGDHASVSSVLWNEMGQRVNDLFWHGGLPSHEDAMNDD